MRELLGKLLDRAIHAGRIAAGDNQRALLPEGLLHHLNQSFAGPERRPFPLLVLDQVVHGRMRDADENENRLGIRSADRFCRLGDGNGNPG